MPQDTYYSAIAADIALQPHEGLTAVRDAEPDSVFDLPNIVVKLAELAPVWVAEVPALGAQLESLLTQPQATLFAVDEIPGRVFLTNGALAAAKSRVIMADGKLGALAPAPEPVESAPEDTSKAERVVSKLIKTAEERFVLGVVLAPEVADSQGDIYSHDEVRKAAHGYMERTGGTLGKQHSEIVTGKLKVLESYLAPADFEVGGQQITSGTWLMGIRVVDDDLWQGVKSGSFTGFSIGGAAVRKPLE